MGRKRTTFGAELKRRRQAAGLTVLQLARSAGISRQTIYSLEADAHNPSLDLLLLLADRIGVDLRDLLAPLCTPRPTADRPPVLPDAPPKRRAKAKAKRKKG
jgi:transcriptional regulator with XRE-family HTH domain